ncbi:MAG: dethiobiotin synthase [Acidobacteria bacterium]|nr:dethiobiotin synthase [Acidobacteriota bacterium]
MNLQGLDRLPSPLWILGTDTGVGKTFVAVQVAAAWAREAPVVYRKPLQTGVTGDGDPRADQAAVAGPGITVETGLTLREPLSPLAAAEAEGRNLDLAALAAWCRRPIPEGARLLLEGAGGVMVPLWGRTPFAAWGAELDIPAFLVARGGLGTLNHTLLSAEALMMRGWRLAGVALNPGLDGSHGAARANAEILGRFLPVPVAVLE